jgi:hypothetical protein
MIVTVENGVLVIRIPLQTPRPSSGRGKTMLVASGSLKSTDVTPGKDVTVAVNAYYKP